jgi:hypothetical protein
MQGNFISKPTVLTLQDAQAALAAAKAGKAAVNVKVKTEPKSPVS